MPQLVGALRIGVELQIAQVDACAGYSPTRYGVDDVPVQPGLHDDAQHILAGIRGLGWEVTGCRELELLAVANGRDSEPAFAQARDGRRRPIHGGSDGLS